jgi:hypothetical protein
MAETTLRVLLVEDDEDDYLLVRITWAKPTVRHSRWSGPRPMRRASTRWLARRTTWR